MPIRLFLAVWLWFLQFFKPAGFGILSLASVCPIISVLAVGLIYGRGATVGGKNGQARYSEVRGPSLPPGVLART